MTLTIRTPAVGIRYTIRSRNGTEHPRGHTGPSSVLSLAISRAIEDGRAGVWTVLEHDDELYRLTRDDDQGHILVEALR